MDDCIIYQDGYLVVYIDHTVLVYIFKFDIAGAYRGHEGLFRTVIDLFLTFEKTDGNQPERLPDTFSPSLLICPFIRGFIVFNDNIPGKSEIPPEVIIETRFRGIFYFKQPIEALVVHFTQICPGYCR